MAAGTVAAGTVAAAVLALAAAAAVVVRRRGLARAPVVSGRAVPPAGTGESPGPTARNDTAASARPRPEAVPLRWGGDLDDAVRWALRHLPDQVKGLLSAEDLRRIMGWNLDYFRSRETSGNGHSPYGHGPVVVAGAEAVAWVLDRAGASGQPYTAAQVHAVLEVQMTYLEALGAVEPDPPW